jgi:hypothetical protein
MRCRLMNDFTLNLWEMRSRLTDDFQGKLYFCKSKILLLFLVFVREVAYVTDPDVRMQICR